MSIYHKAIILNELKFSRHQRCYWSRASVDIIICPGSLQTTYPTMFYSIVYEFHKLGDTGVHGVLQIGLTKPSPVSQQCFHHLGIIHVVCIVLVTYPTTCFNIHIVILLLCRRQFCSNVSGDGIKVGPKGVQALSAWFVS